MEFNRFCELYNWFAFGGPLFIFMFKDEFTCVTFGILLRYF